MEVTLCDNTIFTFDTSCDHARIYYSPLMLKVHAYREKIPMLTVHEVMAAMETAYDTTGKDPVYLDIDSVMSNKDTILFLLRRLTHA